MELSSEDVFVDCGSGLGRAVLQAAREFGVRRACGVEYAASRHQLALKNLEREEMEAASESAGGVAALSERVQLLQGDCAEAARWAPGGALEDASAVFAANLLFDDPLNERLRACLEGCASVRIVACLKAWPDGLTGFGEPKEVPCETSWSAPLQIFDYAAGGVVDHPGTPVYVYERRN